MAIITDYHRGSTRSLATGLHMSGLYGGAALGGLGGFLAERFRWQTAFMLFGAMGLAYGVFLLLTLRDASRNGTRSEVQDALEEKVRLGSALVYLSRQASFWLLLTYFSLLAIAYWAIYGWLPSYLGEHFSLSQGSAGFSATAYLQVASFVGVLVGGVWADGWSRRNLRGRLYVPLVGFCAAGPALFLSASTDILRVAIGGLIIFGMARGFADANNMPILCQITDRRYRATAYGVMNFASCIVGGMMTYAAGALNDARVGLSSVFRWSAVGVVVAVLLLLLVKPKKELEAS